MSWSKNLERIVLKIPDDISSNQIIVQLLTELRKRPCYGPRDELYQVTSKTGRVRLTPEIFTLLKPIGGEK